VPNLFNEKADPSKSPESTRLKGLKWVAKSKKSFYLKHD
jgi:hypothetical protein